MATPSHEEHRALLAAHALGALEDDEAGALGAHLAACEECRRELRSLQDAAARLLAGTELAPAVWEQILRRIRRRPGDE